MVDKITFDMRKTFFGQMRRAMCLSYFTLQLYIRLQSQGPNGPKGPDQTLLMSNMHHCNYYD